MHCKETTSIDIITAGQLDFAALNFAQCGELKNKKKQV